MTNYYLSPFGNSGTPFLLPNGQPNVGGMIYCYAAGTTKMQAVFQDPLGTAAPNPLILDSTGKLATQLFLAAGVAQKFQIQDQFGNNVGIPIDNVLGINDSSMNVSTGEWVASGFTPIFSAANSFSTTGNSTGIFQIGRRIRAQVTAGTVYGTITGSSYGTATTVNVAMDAGMALDSGLSSVNVGFLAGVHPSVPGELPYLTGTISGLSVGGTAGTSETAPWLPNAALVGPRVKCTIFFAPGGTFTPTPGVTATKVTCVGSGGAGGNASGPTSATQVSSGSGGSAGWTAQSMLTPAQIGASQTVTVGVGAAAGSGANGQETSFGSLVIAVYGLAGYPSTPTAPPFTTQAIGSYTSGSVGDIVNSGGNSTAAVVLTTTYAQSGNGGNSSLGGGGMGLYYTTGGFASPSLGGGGGGAQMGPGNSFTSLGGGSGGNGVCIIEEFF